jgi:hypothetical protein
MNPDRRASLTQNGPLPVDSHREWRNPYKTIAIASLSSTNFGALGFIRAI